LPRPPDVGIPRPGLRRRRQAAGFAGGGAEATPRTSWLQRLKSGLARSSNALSEGIAAILTKRKLDAAALDEFEDMLIRADFGPSTAAGSSRRSAPDALRPRDRRRGGEGGARRRDRQGARPVAKPLEIDAGKPHVILVVGVNGTGKTTTIGKLAAKLRAEGKVGVLAAGDTFRAAAIEQLKIWGERTGAPVVAGQQGADAAASPSTR
jgi:fused signal recognition particle receptor